MIDHSILKEEMENIDKMPRNLRVKVAYDRRNAQLQEYEQFMKACYLNEDEPQQRNRRIKFTADLELMDTASRNSLNEMQDLLMNGLNPNQMNHDGLTALHQCCIDGSLEMVTLLLRFGADVNVKDRDLWTPLHAAATCGHFKIVMLLVEAGADMTAINGDGDMPHDIAEDEVTQQYLENQLAKLGLTEEGLDELRRVPHANMMNDINYIITTGGDLNQPLDQGGTFLHTAIANSFNDIVDLLLKNGASVNARDEDGWEPIHVAAYWGNEYAFDLLIQEDDVDITSLTDNGETGYDLCEDQIMKRNILQLLNDVSMKYGSVKPYTATGLREAFEMETSFNETDNEIPDDAIEHGDIVTEALNPTIPKGPGSSNTKQYLEMEDQEKNTSNDSDNEQDVLQDMNLEDSLSSTLLNLEASEQSERRNSVKEAKHLAPLKRANSIERHHHPQIMTKLQETHSSEKSNNSEDSTTPPRSPIITMEDDDDEYSNPWANIGSVNSYKFSELPSNIQSFDEKPKPKIKKQNSKRKAPQPSQVQESSDPYNSRTKEPDTTRGLEYSEKTTSPFERSPSNEKEFIETQESEIDSKLNPQSSLSGVHYSNKDDFILEDLNQLAKPRASASNKSKNFNQEPSSASNKSKNFNQEPSSASNKSNFFNQEPSSASNKSNFFNQEPSSASNKSKNFNQETSLASNKSKNSNQEPSTVSKDFKREDPAPSRNLEQVSRPRGSSTDLEHTHTTDTVTSQKLKHHSKSRAQSTDMKHKYTGNHEMNNNEVRRKMPTNKLTLLDLKRQRQEARQLRTQNFQENESTSVSNSTFYNTSDTCTYEPPPSPTMIRYHFKMANEDSSKQQFIKEKKCIVM